MKNTYKQLVAIGAIIFTGAVQAQTVSTFESILTAPETYWNGEDSTHIGGFADGHAFYANEYNTQFGFWGGGFAVSNKTDTTTDQAANGFEKMYNAISAGGADSSASYAIGQQGSVIKLTGIAAGKQPEGIYITNSNYAYLSMKWGDNFARQFTDSDWFEMEITGFKNGLPADTTLTVSLAEGTDLLGDWLWVDLKPLGDVDSISFALESSDVGQFGMNTPGFFCLDGFTTRDIGTGINQVAAQLKGVSVYPNPASEKVVIETAIKANVIVFDITGQKQLTHSIAMGANTLNIETLHPGIYFLQFESNGITETRKLVVR